jgi:ferrous iron transport protein B
MNVLDQGFTALAGLIKTGHSENLFASFLADGVVAGVGSVVTFLPQILIVFFFLSILENSGYLARAALIMDKVMSRIGLQGKSFLPLISSYACAVPGIMATRTMENKRDRLATIFIAPFMTCSARLPVYALFISAFVPDLPVLGRFLGLRAVTLLGLYALGFLAALATAFGLKSSILRSDKTPFFMELPPYRIPAPKTVALMLWDRSKVFLQQAGTVILAVSMVMWFMTSFPRNHGQADLQSSFAGRLGTLVEPVIRPLGFNWKIGVGLISAQVARDVIISTLATTYRVSSQGKDTLSLRQGLRQDMSPLAAVSLMVFFALAMQCTSTLAVVRRETGGWKIPVCMFLYMNALAYLASFVVYQGGRFLGWG